MLAAKVLQDMGVERVSDLEGGFNAYKAAGGEVIDVPVKLPKPRD